MHPVPPAAQRYDMLSMSFRLDEPTIAYFKDLSEETGIPYQTLINLYLRDCATSGRKLEMDWKPQPASAS